jgi:4-amino-4-deoxy-L-arabinose transferase-like glycosyltransferase
MQQTDAPKVVDITQNSPNRAALWWSVTLFAVALVLRLWFALQIPFPPLDDPAYYIQGARSLRAGTFFDMGITWNYAVNFERLVHPGFDYWMPLTAFVVAGSFSILGDNPLAGQLPMVTAGAILAMLTFWLGRKAFGRLGWSSRQIDVLSGLAGVYVAINPVLVYQSAVPDSQMLFAPLALGALLLLWDERQSRWAALGIGLLIGLSYLARSHAIFLGLAWLLVTGGRWARFKEARREILLNGGLTILGMALIIVPWALRNLLTFGFITAPTALQTVFITDYAQLFRYENQPNLQSFLGLGLDKIIGIRLEAVRHAWFDVLSVMFVPLFFIPFAGLLLLYRRERRVGGGIIYIVLSALLLPATFAVASINGSLYHSAASFAPYAAIGFVYLAWWLAQKLRPRVRVAAFGGLIAVLFLAAAGQFVLSAPATIAEHTRSRQVYERLNVWLVANSPRGAFISDEPSSFNYATGLPALRLPAGDNLEAVARLARRYDARYIVITSTFGNYPALLYSPANTFFTRIYKDVTKGEFEVWELK